jgi:hypothetical protein
MSRQKPILFIDIIEDGTSTKFKISDDARKLLES